MNKNTEKEQPAYCQLNQYNKIANRFSGKEYEYNSQIENYYLRSGITLGNLIPVRQGQEHSVFRVHRIDRTPQLSLPSQSPNLSVQSECMTWLEIRSQNWACRVGYYFVLFYCFQSELTKIIPKRDGIIKKWKGMTHDISRSSSSFLSSNWDSRIKNMSEVKVYFIKFLNTLQKNATQHKRGESYKGTLVGEINIIPKIDIIFLTVFKQAIQRYASHCDEDLDAVCVILQILGFQQVSCEQVTNQHGRVTGFILKVQQFVLRINKEDPVMGKRRNSTKIMQQMYFTIQQPAELIKECESQSKSLHKSLMTDPSSKSERQDQSSRKKKTQQPNLKLFVKICESNATGQSKKSPKSRGSPRSPRSPRNTQKTLGDKISFERKDTIRSEGRINMQDSIGICQKNQKGGYENWPSRQLIRKSIFQRQKDEKEVNNGEQDQVSSEIESSIRNSYPEQKPDLQKQASQKSQVQERGVHTLRVNHQNWNSGSSHTQNSFDLTQDKSGLDQCNSSQQGELNRYLTGGSQLNRFLSNKNSELERQVDKIWKNETDEKSDNLRNKTLDERRKDSDTPSLDSRRQLPFVGHIGNLQCCHSEVQSVESGKEPTNCDVGFDIRIYGPKVLENIQENIKDGLPQGREQIQTIIFRNQVQSILQNPKIPHSLLGQEDTFQRANRNGRKFSANNPISDDLSNSRKAKTYRQESAENIVTSRIKNANEVQKLREIFYNKLCAKSESEPSDLTDNNNCNVNNDNDNCEQSTILQRVSDRHLSWNVRQESSSKTLEPDPTEAVSSTLNPPTISFNGPPQINEKYDHTKVVSRPSLSFEPIEVWPPQHKSIEQNWPQNGSSSCRQVPQRLQNNFADKNIHHSSTNNIQTINQNIIHNNFQKTCTTRPQHIQQPSQQVFPSRYQQSNKKHFFQNNHMYSVGNLTQNTNYGRLDYETYNMQYNRNSLQFTNYDNRNNNMPDRGSLPIFGQIKTLEAQKFSGEMYSERQNNSHKKSLEYLHLMDPHRPINKDQNADIAHNSLNLKLLQGQLNKEEKSQQLRQKYPRDRHLRTATAIRSHIISPNDDPVNGTYIATTESSQLIKGKISLKQLNRKGNEAMRKKVIASNIYEPSNHINSNFSFRNEPNQHQIKVLSVIPLPTHSASREGMIFNKK